MRGHAEQDVRDMTVSRRDDVAGVILAGGRASRMGGVRKGLLRIGGATVIERLLAVYSEFFSEIVIAARDPEPYARFGVPVVADAFDQFSSLSGIHAGVRGVRPSHAFVAACDAPFLQPGMVRVLLERLTGSADVVVPRKDDGWREPLCAIYSKRCLPHIERQLATGDCKIIRFFPHVEVVEVPAADLRRVDPEFLSFINVNTPADVGRAVLREHNTAVS